MLGTLQKIGRVVLVLGILLLVSGLVCAITVGTVAVQILLFSSILVNSIGITLIRSGKQR